MRRAKNQPGDEIAEGNVCRTRNCPSRQQLWSGRGHGEPHEDEGWPGHAAYGGQQWHGRTSGRMEGALSSSCFNHFLCRERKEKAIPISSHEAK